MEKGSKMQFSATEKPSAGKELEESTLEKRGWTKELLEKAKEMVEKLAEAGRATMEVASLKNVSWDGFDIDRSQQKKFDVMFSTDATDNLKKAAIALAAGSAVLVASPAWAGVQKDALKESGEVTKTYELPSGTQQFEVLAGSETLDIGTVAGFEKHTTAEGKTVYHSAKETETPRMLSIKLNVPESKRGTELSIKTVTKHDNDLQLFEGAGGSMRWVIGEDATQNTNLSAIAGIEGSLISHKESIGEKESGWRVPVGLRIMQGLPDKEMPLTLGLSSGFAYWNSDIGEIKGELGTTFDPKTLRAALGREALLALSYTRKAGKLEFTARALSSLGSEGKTAANIGVDLETKRFQTGAGDVVLSSGLGISTEGWGIGKKSAEQSRIHITPAKISFPLLGQDITLNPSITRDVYSGATGGAIDLRVQPYSADKP